MSLEMVSFLKKKKLFLVGYTVDLCTVCIKWFTVGYFCRKDSKIDALRQKFMNWQF